MIAAEATKETREFTCATTEDEKSSYTTSEKIEISYKVRDPLFQEVEI